MSSVLSINNITWCSNMQLKESFLWFSNSKPVSFCRWVRKLGPLTWSQKWMIIGPIKTQEQLNQIKVQSESQKTSRQPNLRSLKLQSLKRATHSNASWMRLTPTCRPRLMIRSSNSIARSCTCHRWLTRVNSMAHLIYLGRDWGTRREIVVTSRSHSCVKKIVMRL